VEHVLGAARLVGDAGGICTASTQQSVSVGLVLPVVVLSRDTYFSTAHLNHSVLQPELPRLVIAVWLHDDVQGDWLQVPLGSAGGSNGPASNLAQNANISDQV
jgi:hypothetical protein